jgi:twitching motility protein PilJ
MSSETNFIQEYGHAEKAYLEGNFEEAVISIERLAIDCPNNPHVLLLRGHIYCYGFQNYELARQQYYLVLRESQEPDLLDFARNGIQAANQLEEKSENNQMTFLDLNQSDPDPHNNNNSSSAENFFDPPEDDIFAESPPEFVDLAPYNHNPNQTDEPTGIAPDWQIEIENNPFEFSDNNEYGFDNIENEDREDTTFVVSGSMPELEEESFSNLDPEDTYEEQADTLITPTDQNRNKPEYFEEIENEGDEYEQIDSDLFDLANIQQELPDTGLFNTETNLSNTGMDLPEANSLGIDDDSFLLAEDSVLGQSSYSGINPATSWNNNEEISLEPIANSNDRGIFAKFTNASLLQKQIITALATGIVSTIVTIVALNAYGDTIVNKKTNSVNTVGIGLLSLVAGFSGLATSLAFGNSIAKGVTRSTNNLQNQFEAIYQGNLNTKATIYSNDEIGQLAMGFNRMTRAISTVTTEAQRRAEETEQAKEDLQRQVIRLLDDVEGAARGDLTVQATVTADVLGAVADAFNLTINNLKEIVRQVKLAAEQVNKGSTDSELFARNQSSDALRMAEELAVTLNSVQMMTDSIQRVAENAREAEDVARTSSVTALKGGEAVERTVSGIMQIRETVSETARKVKSLAVASQEISKIVAVISQIAERTNLLALNASIEAARAGEAGRGFAIVADEVRQLADKSAKALREIEQLVLQIQTETGSVMTAMEESLQEVFDVNDRADQAKRALEDIIQVSKHIDTLVRSITGDTVEQRENSRAVAQVMQAVELTAQETSQESQRVAGSLQNLVGISRSLLSSVERFRIDRER